MTDKIPITSKPEKGVLRIPDDRSAIVVSDLHLGGPEDPETTTRFCHFLDTLLRGDVKVSQDDSPDKSCPKELLPPAKIILLGDILELWDSRGQDRNNPFLDAIVPFLKLREFPCDVIYVTGNHDEDVTELLTTVDNTEKVSGLWKQKFTVFPELKKERNSEPAESLKITWNGHHRLEISPRHYPATTVGGEVKGLESGKVSYAFIHGQQFDKEQLTYTLSRAAGTRIDIVDNIEDIASTSLAKSFTEKNLVFLSFLSIAILGTFVFLPSFSLTVVAKAIGAVSGIVIAAGCLYGIYVFGVSEKKDLPSSGTLSRVFAGIPLFFGIVLAFLYALGSEVFLSLFSFAVVCATIFMVLVTLPKVISRSQKKVYNLSINNKRIGGSKKGTKTEDIYRDVRAQCHNEYYFAHKTHVLVFGHTHVADWYENVREMPDERLRDEPALLINTGTWVNDKGNKNQRPEDINTFVYIDRTGVASMRWVNREIRCKKHFPADKILNLTGEISKISAL